MGIARLKALSESEKDELVLMVLQQLTYQAKQNFAKADVINLGMIIKLIELSIAELDGANKADLTLGLKQLKIAQKKKDLPDDDQIAIDMFNNQQLENL